MPLFEFDCRQCGTAFEKLVSGSALNAVSCPKCASGDIKKRFSRFGFKSSGNSHSGGSHSSSCGSCSTSNCGSCAAG